MTACPCDDEQFGAVEEWLKSRKVSEVECMVADIAGIPRGKILPTEKFLRIFARGMLRVPESVFAQTVTGDVVETDIIPPTEPDVVLCPDPKSLRIVPWYEEPTAQVICDAMYLDGAPARISPRQVLQHVLGLYEKQGWQAIVAPELEFFLSKPNIDPDYPLEPPVGRSGRPESGRQSYSIDVVNEFDPMFEDIYDFCEEQGIDIDTLTHEAGVAQVEINFNHGNPLALADQVFIFKRTVRQSALKHNLYATFMAKPYEHEPGSAMHIHQNVKDLKTGENLFIKNAPKVEGKIDLFQSHIGGLQAFLPAGMPFIAPYVNSYRRIIKHDSAPINTHWGYENRTVGLRVPSAAAEDLRVENRLPGADANPYLAFALSLGCGYLGMMEGSVPTDALEGNAYESDRYALPRHLLDALTLLSEQTKLHALLGSDFVRLFLDVKAAEHDAFQQVISPWEREHLLLNV